MDAILQSAFLKALGWSLLDSLWQIGIVWVFYLLVTRNNRRFTADQRHSFALFSLAGSSFCFLATFFIHLANNTPGFGATILGKFISSNFSTVAAFLLPWVSVAYLAATIFLLIRLCRQFQLTSKLATTGLVKADPEIRVFLQELSGRMGIKKPIRVWISTLVETPLTIGFWKPVILLPVAIVNHLSVKQTESIILHELYHIQRNDFLINLAISVADILLFFNPFARYFSDLIQQEREHRCDDMVLQFRYEPALYAQALLKLEQARAGKPGISLAATGTSRFLLLARIKRMLTGENQVQPVSQRLVAFLLTVLILAYLTASTLQVPTPAGRTQLTLALRESRISTGNNDAGVAAFSTVSMPVTAADTNPGDAEPAIDNDDQRSPDIDNDTETGIENELARVIVSEKIDNMISSETPVQAEERLAAFADEPGAVDYTINIPDNTVPAPPSAGEKIYPYVPRSSFNYKEVGDTSFLPAKAVTEELKASIRLSRAIESIQDMDWKKVEEKLQLSGEKINSEKLELELKKALLEIDWKSLDKNLANSLKASNAEIEKYKTQLATRYQQFIQARQKHAEAARIAESTIVEERLRLAPRPAQKSSKVKKIVTI